MSIFTFKRSLIPYAMAAILAAVATINLQAQVIRAYGAPIYSDNLKGGHTMFGNTILEGSGMNSIQTGTAANDWETSGEGNDGKNMQYIDVDGSNYAPPTSIVAYGSSWSMYRRASSGSNEYNYSTSNGPGSYTSTSYSQTSSAWLTGSAPFRFNLGSWWSGGTEVTSSPSRARSRNAYYFRKSVNISASDLALYTSVTINVEYDDGIIVFVNGTEIGRSDMASGSFNYDTDASSCNGGSSARTATFNVPLNLLTSGDNIIAAEVHQGNNCSGNADMYFNLEMTGANNVANTFNSSSADLVFPSVAGAFNVKYARLYWGGRINSAIPHATRKSVKVRKGTGAYATITDANIDTTELGGGYAAYQCYIDITAFIKTNGAGTYTVADIAVQTGSSSSGGNYGGWAMVVVYENPNLNYSTVRLYDGFLKVEDGGSQTINLTGLSAPGEATTASDIYMTTMAWEGDASIGSGSSNPDGDYIRVNGVAVSDALNPARNFWNGTITKNGAHVTTKNPHYLNQMGLDIDEVQVGTGYGINASTTQLTVEFGTESDQYFPSVFAFTMKAKPALVELNKNGTITGPGAAQKLLYPNETITYIMSGVNSGTGNALNTVITDTVPFGLTYVPNSLKITTSPGGFTGNKTDAAGDDQAEVLTGSGKTYIKYYIGTGAVAGNGGTLQPGQSYTVSFQCTTPANATPLNTVSNTARITGIGADGESFVDDGTFVFGPGGVTLDVNLKAFSVAKENDRALLKWTTAGEVRNDRFNIERSSDGLSFVKVGTVYGNGTTNDIKHYDFADDIANASGIVYYRLSIVDTDGKITYSKIVALRLGGLTTLTNFAVYPNPFTSNVKMQINSARESKITVRISNAAGVQVLTRNFTLQQGENIVVVQNLEALMPGLHTMEIISEDGKVTQKIMKK